MTDKVEIQGKTVDEAVSEALLRMGARRDEVDVTVLEEPKNGLFGFLGGRPARVIVRRRAGGRSRSRSNDFRVDSKDHPPHDLGRGDGRGGRSRRGGRGRGRGVDRDSEGEGAREGRGARAEGRSGGRGGRGRRSEDRENQENRENRENAENKETREGRPARESRGGRRDDSRRGGRGERPAREREEVRAAGQDVARDDDQDQKRGSRRRRGRRGGRGRSGGTRDSRPQPAVETMDRLDLDHDQLSSIAAEQAEFHARIQAQAAEGLDDAPAAAAGAESERDESRGRGRRGGRSRGGRGRRRDEERPAERRPAASTANGADEPILPVTESEEPVPNGPEDPAPNRHEERAPNRGDEPAPVDEPIAAGIKASSYAQPKRGLTEEALDGALGDLASGMLVRAGFPCRCEVKPGEYRTVKIVTDDTSAGMLIGRHGQTIDAVEHLVERMASTAAGDRVRMNLDINNYRRRREDTLLDQVDRAVSELRATGEDVHLEPMDARERRIVHLEAANHEGLRTWTVSGPGGKHVVIGIDDGSDRGQDDEPVEVVQDDTDGAAEAIEAAPVETVATDDSGAEAPAVEAAAAEDGEEPERPGADA